MVRGSEGKLHLNDKPIEQSLVACAMLQPRLLDEIALIIRPEMIADTATREVFNTCMDLHVKNKAIDVVLIANALKKAKKLNEIGGAAFLNELMETVPHTAHWDNYAAAVRRDWMRREAMFAGERIIRMMSDPSREPEDAIGEADRTMIELTEAMESGSADVVDIGNILFELEDNLVKADHRSDGIPASTSNITEKIGGFGEGHLTVIAARPGVGKTAMALNMAANWAKNGIPGLIISAEQSKLEIGDRLLSMQSGESLRAMRKGEVDPLRLDSAKSEMVDWKLMVDDRGRPSIIQVEAVARRYKRKIDIRYLIVDYLQIIAPSDSRMPREQQIAEISGRLKALAKSLNISVIALAQLNRQSENRDNKRPKLSDLRDSGAIEQDADQVILLWRPNMDSPDAPIEEQREAVAIVAKNRHGPTGDAQLVYLAECFQFRERAEPSIATAGYQW